ncbi:MAG: D-tyrosyl-tRNA(Tyr) deacylase [Bacteroidales bacterium]|nr:D-tyrosyl-tRNA(Tyr) deacylase [Bacteroidales bacterium]
MRVVLQRVSQASVEIDRQITASIQQGILILLGIEEADNQEDIDWLCGKIIRLRIFPDANQVMNLSVTEIGGALLVVSQFTLHASTRKGNRPAYIKAARPETAIPLYERFVATLKTASGLLVKTGTFGAMMNISLVNEGPVTIIIDSKSKE